MTRMKRMKKSRDRVYGVRCSHLGMGRQTLYQGNLLRGTLIIVPRIRPGLYEAVGLSDNICV